MAASTVGNNKEGLVSTKEIDFLDQDPVIRGQRYACVSFVSPEEVIAKKEVFVVNRFVAGLAADVDVMLSNVAAKFADDADVQDSVRLIRERHGYMWSEETAQAEYAAFAQAKADELDAAFRDAHKFGTSVRGFKIRGVYDTVEDATSRAQAIKRFDDKFHVYVAEVGCWCPWSPDPNAIQDVQYAETQLNTMMKKYNESMEAKTEMYDARKREKVERMHIEREVWLEAHKRELAEAKTRKEEAAEEAKVEVEAKVEEEAKGGAEDVKDVEDVVVEEAKGAVEEVEDGKEVTNEEASSV